MFDLRQVLRRGSAMVDSDFMRLYHYRYSPPQTDICLILNVITSSLRLFYVCFCIWILSRCS